MKQNNFSRLDRLFNAKSVVFIGGKDIFTPINEIKRRGFKGDIWVINPKRSKLLGYKCYKTVQELPDPPDAAFLAVPAANVIQVITDLNKRNCGGVVCYSAGFKEIGIKGKKLEKRLVLAAGQMPIIGPNCYGLINYIDNLALWPFAHGGYSPGWGAAIITQSGMLSSDITMTQRSIPLSYMVSLGNQAVLGMEHLIRYFSEKNPVTALGIHVEGINDIEEFCSAAIYALKLGKPIVMFKTGKSKIGKRLTESHTGSLSGDNEAFSALCKKLGIIEVDDAVQFLETLKFMSICGPVKSKRILGFTCSGGGATMLADYAESIKLEFPNFSRKAKAELNKLLPSIATVSNPLDYTTPIWGISDKTLPVFSKSLELNKAETAIIVQDFPSEGLDESEKYYWNDSLSFIKAASEYNITKVVCSTFPENINKKIRQKLIRNGSAPMQGIKETLLAVRSAYEYYTKRKSKNSISKISRSIEFKESIFLNEYAGKESLKKKEISAPDSVKIKEPIDSKAFKNISFPVVLKFSSPHLLHKTELGAVRTNIKSIKELNLEFQNMKKLIGKAEAFKSSGVYFCEEMADVPIAELFLSFRSDPVFGKVMVVGMGGIYTEIFNDTKTLILPVSRQELLSHLTELKGYKIILGYRNKLKVNKNKLLDGLFNLIDFFLDETNECVSLEINPLFVYERSVKVIDCVMERKVS